MQHTRWLHGMAISSAPCQGVTGFNAPANLVSCKSCNSDAVYIGACPGISRLWPKHHNARVWLRRGDQNTRQVCQPKTWHEIYYGISSEEALIKSHNLKPFEDGFTENSHAW